MPRLKHFLTGEEFTSEEVRSLLTDAEMYRQDRASRQDKPLAGKTVALIFEKPSLRTRLSFTVGIQELGGQVIELLGSQKKNEEPEDAIRVIQGMVHAVMLRTFEHETFERMKKHAKIPLINGLSDSHHPCQALADFLTLHQRFGRLEGLTLSYIGDGNNVLHSLMLLGPAVGVNIHYACPEGYQPDIEILARAQKRAKYFGSRIQSFKTPQDAAQNADALYTDVWTSMGFEEENAKRIQDFQGYQINAELLDMASPLAIVLHCLPMNKGQEITADIVEHSRCAVFQQSENRLHVQKALLKRLMQPLVVENDRLYGLERYI